MNSEHASDSWVQRVSDAIIHRSAPGEFRGVCLVQLAAESLARSGRTFEGRHPNAIVAQAFAVANNGGVDEFCSAIGDALQRVFAAAQLEVSMRKHLPTPATEWPAILILPVRRQTIVNDDTAALIAMAKHLGRHYPGVNPLPRLVVKFEK